MLTEDDERMIKAIKRDLKNVKDDELRRDILAIVEIAETYLLKSEAMAP